MKKFVFIFSLPLILIGSRPALATDIYIPEDLAVIFFIINYTACMAFLIALILILLELLFKRPLLYKTLLILFSILVSAYIIGTVHFYIFKFIL